MDHAHATREQEIGGMDTRLFVNGLCGGEVLWRLGGLSLSASLRCVVLTETLQVHRICFALALLHTILSLLLIGVKDTKTKRAAIQNGCAVRFRFTRTFTYPFLADGGDRKSSTLR